MQEIRSCATGVVREGLPEDVIFEPRPDWWKEPVIGKSGGGRAFQEERPTVQRHCGGRTGVLRNKKQQGSGGFGEQ